MKAPLLVIGATGTLGRHLVAAGRRRGFEVYATARQAAPGRRHFCLPDDDANAFLDRLPTLPAAAFVCAAESGIDRCRQDPTSEAINIVATQRLFAALTARGILPVFYSSDLVFSGRPGAAADGYRESDPCQPSTAYGRQKQQAEEGLRQLGEKHLILRLAKLYSGDGDNGCDVSPLAQWRQALAEGQAIRCATDQWLTPTWAGDVAAVSFALLERNHSGTVHVAAPESFTRFSLAVRLARQWGFDAGLVSPCLIGDFAFAEPRPQDNRLNTDYLRRLLDFHFHPVACVRPDLTLATEKEH
ncbi:MAG: dTDP-4-dehydrorhamnose reductase [Pseudomonadota bacterium]|nr:dTDP-4-dehydrorhamnose reductase [Pseudomonadota bacterium]MDQ5917552.1 dTDP-4-dehydrorhamnose reductase [Pseudomonadota bacterium]